MDRRFDAIAIGSGLGGLTAAALYSLSGKRVLVLERNASFGGAASVYRAGDLTIEASLHEMDGFDEGDVKRQILGAIGILDELELVEVGDLYEVRSPLLGDPFVMPAGLDQAIAATSARFPGHSGALRKYFGEIQKARVALHLAARHQDDRLWWILNAPVLPLRLRPLIRLGRISLSEMLRQAFGEDEAVKLALAAHLAYYADDPDELAALRWSTAQASYHIGGGHYPRGGSQTLTDALVSRVRATGGEVEAGREVTRILLSEGRAVGVEHVARAAEGADRDAREERAPVVFGNAAPHVMAAMLPREDRDRFMSAYAERPVSISAWQVALGFHRKPREFGVERYSTAIFPEWMRSLKDAARNMEIMAEAPGERMPYFIFVDYTAVETGLTPDPPFLGTLVGVDRASNWSGLSSREYQERTSRWAEAMVGALDREFPGIAGAIVQRSMTTALNIERYLNTPGGAIYGFAPGVPTPRRPIQPVTSVDCLFLSSAYTGLAGYTGAMVGGAAAVRAAKKRLGEGA